MALIMPYRTQKPSSNGYNNGENIYKPLKSFGNYSSTNKTADQNVKSLSNANSFGNICGDEVDSLKLSSNDRRISRSSDDMIDMEGSSNSSGSSVSSDPIYSTINKAKKLITNGNNIEVESSYSSSRNIRKAPASFGTSNQLRNFTVHRNNVNNNRNDGITDTVAIIYTGKNNRKTGDLGNDLSHELTSTFKPVETSM